MPDILLCRRDIDFYLHDWLDVERLIDRGTVDAFIDLSEELAEDLFLPHYKQSDIEEPSLTADGVHVLPAIGVALSQYAELGFFSANFDETLGGLGLPNVACAASFAYFAAANIATAAYSMLTIANARLITTFGSGAQIERFAKPQIAGRWFGTMCLSEPQAGSSLAEIRTRAVADGIDELGDRYRLVGNKMWISGGDQDVSENIVHLVLAKIPDEEGRLTAGTDGLSLFIVPKILPNAHRNDIAVAGLNHKMGYRGTANCLLNFGEREGALGWLVGRPGEGLRQMFVMMNEARINIGLGAAALGYRSHRLSVAYARERLQGRRIGERTEGSVAIINHPDVKLMLLTQKALVEGGLALCLYTAKLLDQKADKDSAALLSLLTPVVKTWTSEQGLVANDIAIQIHGGYGYTRDFDVEQLWRDNRLNPIHEGTTGIQAIDLLGRKLLRDGSGLPVLERRLVAVAQQSHAMPLLARQGVALLETWRDMMFALDILKVTETTRAYDNATPFLRAFGHIVVAWIWLEQALAAQRLSGKSEGDRAFVEGKLRACRYFFEFELPRANVWLRVIAIGSDGAAGAPVEIF